MEERNTVPQAADGVMMMDERSDSPPSLERILLDYRERAWSPETRRALRRDLCAWAAQQDAASKPSYFLLRRDDHGYTTVSRQFPSYSHDCTSCAFLGTWQDWDLYYCPKTVEGEAVAQRNGSSLSAPISTISDHPALRTARARYLELEDPGCEDEDYHDHDHDHDHDESLDSLASRLHEEAACRQCSVMIEHVAGQWSIWGGTRRAPEDLLGCGATLRLAIREALQQWES